jgi:hypothetical protein
MGRTLRAASAATHERKGGVTVVVADLYRSNASVLISQSHTAVIHTPCAVLLSIPIDKHDSDKQQSCKLPVQCSVATH